MKTRIISAFPGTGKSHIFRERSRSVKVIDSDSSKFSWIIDENGNKVRNPEFPLNYLEHIKENIGHVDYIFVSTHESVRRVLNKMRVEYTIVYPDRSLKEIYKERYIKRGNDESFVNLMMNRWDEFIDQLETERFPNRIVLHGSQYLTDVLDISLCVRIEGEVR